MRMKLCAALVGGIVVSAGVAQAATPQGSKPLLVQFDFSATVQADGTLADIQPDVALEETFQSMVRGRVATWHYQPAQWQGRSAASPISQTIWAHVVPTADGGFAFRIAEVTGQRKSEADARRMGGVPYPPPRFPPDLMQKGVNAVLLYSVQYDQAGKPQQIDLMYPVEVDSIHMRLDGAVRDAMAQWTVRHSFGGQPIACRSKVPMVFASRNAPVLEELAEVAALFDRYTDMCPEAKLETPVAGTFL